MHNRQTPELQLAFDLVSYTDRSLFLTGRAGTGKTTFLQQLRAQSLKRMVVVAPTGVAAINAGGMTIHSFFQLPFSPFVPGRTETAGQGNNTQRYRFSGQKKNLIKSLDLLVIDEISMVRADLLDAISDVLKRIRRNDKPFGGVQLLMIGDLQQLSPVVKEEEWQLLRSYYHTPYFFSSQALGATAYEGLELTHVFRQSDERFIHLLNQIRSGKPQAHVMEEFNSRVNPDFVVKPGYITLTTHNHKAATINDRQLEALDTRAAVFRARVDGNFPDYSFPTEERLTLKTGAQVMFVKNDPSPDKEYFNGKIGTIVDIDDDKVTVRVNDGDDITVSALPWYNMRYRLNAETKEVEETVEGTFLQIPLRLAWAITIHKSQGLTFDQAIIDAREAFAHGQVYVALSRCRTLEGLVLSTPLQVSGLRQDMAVERFTRNLSTPGPEQVSALKKAYVEQTISDLFDFTDLRKMMLALIHQLQQNDLVLQRSLLDQVEQINGQLKTEVMDVSISFQRQLQHLFHTTDDPQTDEHIRERITKGAAYFNEKLNLLLLDKLDDLEIDTDNQVVRKTIASLLEQLQQQVSFKYQCLNGVLDGFEMKRYLELRAKALITDTVKRKKKASRDIAFSENDKDEDLYQKLKKWRTKQAADNNIKAYMVMPIKTLVALAAIKPTDQEQLAGIKGLGKKRIAQYGAAILEVILDHEGLDAVPHEVSMDKPDISNKKEPKLPSHHHTLQLWKQGKTPKEISDLRSMTPGTIHRHLEQLVTENLIPMESVISTHKAEIIKELFITVGPVSLSEARDILGEDYDWWELRLVKKSLSFDDITPEP